MSEQLSFTALRAFDADGLPAGGALAYFYETGTTTPVTVYAEDTLITPLPSPLVADADGYFAQVFSDGAVQIKCVVKDSDSVVISTIDPVSVSFSSSAATSVTFTPTAAIPQTNVQLAIEQVEANSEAVEVKVDAAQAEINALGTAADLNIETTVTNDDTLLPTGGAVVDYIPAVLPSLLNATGSAPLYACRAWVNFNGTGTVAIRGSGNVANITDNGVGDYTVTLTTAMPDINCAVMVSGGGNSVGVPSIGPNAYMLTTSTIRIVTGSGSTTLNDWEYIFMAIFR